MADKPKPKIAIGRNKTKETLREKSERIANESGEKKVRRIKSTATAAGKPFKSLHRFGQKEYYLPLPDNKLGRFLNKKRRLTPRYFIDAFKEMRLVEWPNKRTTIRLTVAVFVFALFFGLVIALVDFGLDKVFKKVFVD